MVKVLDKSLVGNGRRCILIVFFKFCSGDSAASMQELVKCMARACVKVTYTRDFSF